MINVINNGIANGIPRPNGIRYSTIIMLAIDIKILETKIGWDVFVSKKKSASKTYFLLGSDIHIHFGFDNSIPPESCKQNNFPSPWHLLMLK